MPSEAVLPAIKLYADSGLGNPVLIHELMIGAEEEGVPCEVDSAAEGQAVALAFKAAADSILGVGLGIDRNGIAAVHYNKLPEDSPLFTLNYRIDSDKLRFLSCNAARLVKGVPFSL
ncbi:MAG: glycerol dehydratase reactivase beta/small subunit family protein [Treponema sp.]|jgi:hypothetical protein|nr:glycerol dehydratase reactivase beta/small subunit family protein [Treponema sp.]